LFLVDGFLEEVLLCVEGGGDAAFVLGVLEVDDVMGFYLLGVGVLLVGAVFDEFPQAFAFVLVYDRRPFLVRLLYLRTGLFVL
jgi:hypothetical protein